MVDLSGQLLFKILVVAKHDTARHDTQRKTKV